MRNGFGSGTHRERDPEIANQRGDDVAVPRAVLAPGVPAAKADAGGVDRFLPERTESLALKCGVAIADFAAEKERLQAVIGCAREDQTAQDLAALFGGQ